MARESFFELDQSFFVGCDAARGPWDENLCHAGPVAAALARQIEQLADTTYRLVRLSMDLERPVPMSGFSVQVQPGRQGRRLATGSAEVTNRDGRILIRATYAMLRPKDDVESVALTNAPDKLADAKVGPFPIEQSRHAKPMFGSRVDIRYPPGHANTPGPTKLWMRTPNLLAKETPSPFQKLCPIADCGNAISRLAEVTEVGFVNSDLTIVAHRAPRTDWLMSDAVSHWHGDGIGLAEARISDEHGPVASAMQTLVIE